MKHRAPQFDLPGTEYIFNLSGETLPPVQDVAPVRQDATDEELTAPGLIIALQDLHNACEHWEDQNDPVLKNAREVISKAKGEA